MVGTLLFYPYDFCIFTFWPQELSFMQEFGEQKTISGSTYSCR